MLLIQQIVIYLNHIFFLSVFCGLSIGRLQSHKTSGLSLQKVGAH